ncbi:hypothetical protein V6N12_037909 [Hibiscus sabdariffa]|uniref:Uncharacterized protein n=1 Tax=Hibiscus sabdariffa TaxID=183260 RepID=A0ABR2B046_9ROSI
MRRFESIRQFVNGKEQRRVMEGEVLRRVDNGVSHMGNIITVFVSSLPQKLHWQGLWASFTDAFIPVKRSHDSCRFGFV